MFAEFNSLNVFISSSADVYSSREREGRVALSHGARSTLPLSARHGEESGVVRPSKEDPYFDLGQQENLGREQGRFGQR